LFEQQVEQTPEAVAVIADDGTLTYRELNQRADRLAHHLMTRHGVRLDTTVAVALPRSLALITTLLAILKAGANYLPLDPANPPHRTHHMLMDANVAVAVALDASSFPATALDRVRVVHPDACLKDPVGAYRRASPTLANLAYVMYTSGSTGVPKGVGITHGNVVNIIRYWHARLGDQAWQHTLASTSLSFDVSVFEIFTTLCHGGTAELVDNVLEIADRGGWRGGMISTIPTGLLAVLNSDAKVTANTVVFAGEPVTGAIVTRTRAEVDGARIVNAYGQTETFYVSAHEIGHDGESVRCIGTPVSNATVYVLDRMMRPVATGVPGELYVSGLQVSRGYIGQPAMTASRYVCNPFVADGQRMYRTGDTVKWTPQGNLEYIGRADRQTKVRGVRVELAEIEAVLEANPMVDTAVAVVRDQRLLAFVTLAITDSSTSSEVGALLKDHVRHHVTSHSVPTTIVPIAEFPLTLTGKVDRAKLPDIDLGGTVYKAPRNEREIALQSLFTEVLARDTPVGIGDSFFELGGHSLSATRLSSRIRRELRIEVTVREILENPTVEQLASQLSAARPLRPELSVPHRPQHIPLSFAQQRQWFLNQYEKSARYNIPLALKVFGNIEHTQFEQAVNDVVHRHEILRTVYREIDGTPHQKILDIEDVQVRVPVQKASAATLGEQLRAGACHVFDLANELPVRVIVFDVDAGEHVLLILLHHIAADGGSLYPLVDDLALAYLARVQGTRAWDRPMPTQYADFALWQRHLLSGHYTDQMLIDQSNYWIKELEGSPDQLRLPFDHPRSKAPTFEGGQIEFHIPRAVLRRAEGLARANNATLAMVFHAALAVLLHRIGGGDDIPIGVPIAGRTDQSIENLVGFFVNTVVIRSDMSGRPSFESVLAGVQQKMFAAHENQDLPFEKLVELLNPTRSTSAHPLFQVSFAWQNNKMPDMARAGLHTELVPVPVGLSKFDLLFNIAEIPATETECRVIGYLEYSRELFEEQTAQRIVDTYTRLLTEICADAGTSIDRYPMVDTPQAEPGLDAFDSNTAPVPQLSVPQRFARSAEQHPDRVAIVWKNDAITYRELRTRALGVAAELVDRGAAPGDIIGIALPRTPDMIVAVLGVLMSGAAYLPIDIEAPIGRTGRILSEAQPPIIVSTSAAVRDLPVGGAITVNIDSIPTPCAGSADSIDRHPQMSDPAYVMYTSGSTGVPKGVAVTHTAISNCITQLLTHLPDPDNVSMVACTSIGFDVSAFEVFTPLCTGGTVHLVENALELTERWPAGVNTLSMVPSVFGEICRELAIKPEIDAIVFAGEALSPQLVERARTLLPNARVINGYGPTETIYATAHIADTTTTQATPIGRPLGNVCVYVLGGGLLPVPVGVVGELYISGAGVARGYHRRPGLT
ncbi:amino acid adenylation domain-containing protein, partial [Nocardia abscessus]|uniref:amino acid adenylation domain-containing protein n=1 Tax=Nocardia abscessus TaxID=120957 RepID=UPI00245461C7